jgi:hypothetical protein
VKHSIASALLLLVIALCFLGTRVLAMAPAEFAGEAVTAEEREEQGHNDPLSRRVRTDGKKFRSFLNSSTLIRSTVNINPENIHLLQVFRV